MKNLIKKAVRHDFTFMSFIVIFFIMFLSFLVLMFWHCHKWIVDSSHGFFPDIIFFKILFTILVMATIALCFCISISMAMIKLEDT